MELGEIPDSEEWLKVFDECAREGDGRADGFEGKIQYAKTGREAVVKGTEEAGEGIVQGSGFALRSFEVE